MRVPAGFTVPLKILRGVICFFFTMNLISAGIEFSAGRYWWSVACLASAVLCVCAVTTITLILRRSYD